MSSEFTVIYWNTWFDLQNGHRDDGTLVCDRLRRLIDRYEPDIFGLNEVFAPDKQTQPIVVQFLAHAGYHTVFSPVITSVNGEVIGNVFASKRKPLRTRNFTFGQTARSHIEWYADYTSKLTGADIRINGKTITVLVTHLCLMLPPDFVTHIKQRLSYDQLIRSIPRTNLIIGGDFNESKYMPFWLRTPRWLRRKTGGLRNPTWVLDASPHTPFRGNLDNLIYSTVGSLDLQVFKVLDRFPSDHSPLLARFSVKS